MPATKKLVLLPATTARASVFRQAGWSPATANWTKTVSADAGGTLYRATSGLDEGVTTACDPVMRDATVSATTVDVALVALTPYLAVPSMSEMALCSGVQV